MLIYFFIDGIMSGCIQYAQDDDFSQNNPVSITVGSSLATIDLYCIRVYDNDLTAEQMKDNWIADTQDGSLLLERYARNNIYDEYGSILPANLPSDLPYMVIECAELPQYKGDKKTVSGRYNLGNNRILGYSSVKGKLVPNKDADAVRLIYALFLRGKNVEEIRRRLTDIGVRTKTGKPISHGDTRMRSMPSGPG